MLSRLKRRQFTSEVIEKTVGYLEDNNYIDDRRFCLLFISSCLEKGLGRRRMEFALKKLGVCADLIEESFRDKSVFQHNIEEVLLKAIKRYQGKDNFFQKVVRFMVGRGFEYSEIIQHLQNYQQ